MRDKVVQMRDYKGRRHTPELKPEGKREAIVIILPCVRIERPCECPPDEPRPAC